MYLCLHAQTGTVSTSHNEVRGLWQPGAVDGAPVASIAIATGDYCSPYMCPLQLMGLIPSGYVIHVNSFDFT
jgi:hypothetical protein